MMLAVVIAPRAAAADIDNEKADKLFAEAFALRETNPAEACAKFEEALGYNPQAISTRLNVALCDERNGRIASAVEKFTEVADRARVQNLSEYLLVAEDRLRVLTPELSFVTITFAEPPAPETTLLVDDRVIPLDKLEKRAIDPGDRVIVVTAPGRVAYRTSLRIEKRKDASLVIPALEPQRVVNSSRRTIGKITVVAGGATFATGIVLGLTANSRYNAQFGPDGPCRAGNVCDTSDAASKVESARTLGTVSTVVTIVGLGAAAVGGYLWWRSPGNEQQRGVAYIGPHASLDGAGVVAAGRF
jgi:hypothetical protein